MEWQQGMPKESGLYWLLIKTPVDFIQPMIFYAASKTHEAIYIINMSWYDADDNGNIIIDERVYKTDDASLVCKEDQQNTYWMRIPQPDTNVSDRKE